MADLLLRPANDSVRPLPVVELALRVRPAPGGDPAAPRFVLDPQYELWRARRFPRERLHFCPLDAYDRQVRAASGLMTLEEMDARLRKAVALTGGYALDLAGRRWPRTAMFAVGSIGCRVLLEFLFRWG